MKKLLLFMFLILTFLNLSITTLAQYDSWEEEIINEIGVEKFENFKKTNEYDVKKFLSDNQLGELLDYSRGKLSYDSKTFKTIESNQIRALTNKKIHDTNCQFDFYFNSKGKLLTVILGRPISSGGIIYNIDKRFGKTIKKEEGLKIINKFKNSEAYFDEDDFHIKLQKIVLEKMDRPNTYKGIKCVFKLHKDYCWVNLVYSEETVLKKKMNKRISATFDYNNNLIEIIDWEKAFMR